MAETEKKNARVKDYASILTPVITEKSSQLGSATKTTVVFKVHKNATKPDIKEAVERVFNVKVDGIRTVNVIGKAKRTAKSSGFRSNTRKAYVTLKEGQKISVVEGL